MRIACGAVLACAAALAAPTARAQPRGLAPGEEVQMRITYAHLLAGHASLRITAAEHEQRRVLEFVSAAKSAGFFAWLLRFRVNDRTVATWDPATGCSLRIEKHLREGRAVRDQVVTFDPAGGSAAVEDPKIPQTRFEVEPCTLDVLSAFFVTRLRGVSEDAALSLPVFDNGKRYTLAVRFLGREKLDLPAPFGRHTPTVIVEPLLAEGTGLFVKRGRLKIWLTDDERRVPVRMRAKVAVGSVSADLESYTAGQATETP